MKQAILTAATALFAERGYANTTTRAIAQEAQSSAVLLYKYFNSKAELFEVAVSTRIDAMMDEARNLIQRRPTSERIEYSQDFVRALYKLMSADKDLMLALITTRAYEASPDDDDGKPVGLHRFFEGAEARLSKSWNEVGVESDIPASQASRIAFASVLAVALLGDLLFDDVRNEAEIADNVAKFVARGIYGAGLAAPAQERARRRRQRLRAAEGVSRRR